MKGVFLVTSGLEGSVGITASGVSQMLGCIRIAKNVGYTRVCWPEILIHQS